MNCPATTASSSAVWPPRACSIIENPDTAPNPGSAGGLNGTTMASGRLRVAAATLPTIVEACRSLPGRSSQGCSLRIRNAPFEAAVPEMMS